MASPFVYAFSDISNMVNSRIKGKKNNLVSETVLYNSQVRQLNALVDMRSTKRRASIGPGVFTNVYSYPMPSDLKGTGICDVIKQGLDRTEDWFLTTVQEFDQVKTFEKNMLALDDHDGLRFLRIATELNNTELTIDEMDAITGWSLNAGGTNLREDTVNFISGTGSVEFDTLAVGTTCTLTKSTIGPLDLTAYNATEVFLWVYIPALTNLTSFTLKWGSDASNYWSATVTTTHEGLAFYVGWNLLRFAWPATSTGSPVITAVSYTQFTITESAMSAQTGWRVDQIITRIPLLHDILYYSKFAWQSAAGVYKENSTLTTDLLVADTEEFDLYVKFCSYGAALELRDKDAKDILTEAKEEILAYSMKYPSERIPYETTYERLASIEGDWDMPIHDGWDGKKWLE